MEERQRIHHQNGIKWKWIRREEERRWRKRMKCFWCHIYSHWSWCAAYYTIRYISNERVLLLLVLCMGFVVALYFVWQSASANLQCLSDKWILRSFFIPISPSRSLFFPVVHSIALPRFHPCHGWTTAMYTYAGGIELTETTFGWFCIWHCDCTAIHEFETEFTT